LGIEASALQFENDQVGVLFGILDDQNAQGRGWELNRCVAHCFVS
jgi:hypothetical protein